MANDNANPKLPTGTHELQEKYASAVVKLMRPLMKIRNTFSRDYEGNPASGSVKVPVRSLEVQVKDYNIAQGISPAQSATSYLPILISHDKAINELIDGYEASAVPDNLVAQRLESASFSNAKVLEENAIATLLGGTESTQDNCTTSNVYANIVKDIAILAKKGVDKNRMYVAIDYNTETLLLTDEKYSNTASQIGAELAREGVVGKINGVKVIVEDLGKDSQNNDVEYIVYGVDWCEAIDAFKSNPHIVDLDTGSDKYVNASALKGRMVYEDALTNKEAVIVKKKVTSPEPTKYTVTYDVNGGEGTIEPVEVTAGESITLNDGTGITPPENKEFKGWAKSNSAQNPTVNSPFTPEADVTLYAVYGDETPAGTE